MCPKLALTATAVILLAAPVCAQQAPAAAPIQSTGIIMQDGHQRATPRTRTGRPGPKASRKAREQADRDGALGRAAFWGQEFDNDPDDAEAGLKLALALRQLGQFGRAAETAEDVALRHPENTDAMLDTARAYIAGGNAFYAIAPAKRAQVLNPRDWRSYSLLGVAYEQLGRTDEAFVAYKEAERLAPNNPDVLTNFALFQAGQGQLDQAEILLRRAVTLPGAKAQTRQDLAHVLGRLGKFDEAERLMRADLPPGVAANNIAYLKALHEAPAAPPPAATPSTGRTWEALRDGS